MRSINSVTIVGHMGQDASIKSMNSGGRVATLNVATDHSYKNRDNGEWVNRTEWHRVVTFLDGLIDMLEKHGRKGRLVAVQGSLRTRKWTDDKGTDRYSTEIIVSPGSQIQFLDKAEASNADAGQPPADDQTPPPADDDIPF